MTLTRVDTSQSKQSTANFEIPTQPLSAFAIEYLFTVKLNAVERSGSGVELRTLDYENPGSNPGCGVKTMGKFFHSTLLQFTQLNK